ncbi:MAG: recombinase family protein [Candidatus Acidiferrales bacterium]
MRECVLYARVSSKDQEREGYSIPAQQKLLREYAARNDFHIAREFVDVETAKMTGRKRFGEMLQFLQANSHCRAVIVEKTDRLYRNFRDYVILEDLNVEIHLPKENQIISRNSKSQAKLLHGMQLVMARNYIDNLREEVKKGMREKAEQGIYPSRPPLGYRNNKLQHTIEEDPGKAPIARRMFELYASGRYSLSGLRVTLKQEFCISLAKGYLERLLKNPFYVGRFYWEKRLYDGTHTPLVSHDLFQRVQDVFHGRSKPRYQTREFAFRGLLTCAYDSCKVTAELKKGKYTYYRCTQFRGKCDLPYFREESLAERLGKILLDIHIPDGILSQLQESLLADKGRQEELTEQQRRTLEQRVAQVRRRMDLAYQDKLDGKISGELWDRKSTEWQAEEWQILASLQTLEAAKPERFLDAARTLELANKAYFLYLKQPPAEQAKLLKIVLSNCAIDAASLYPTYRKPFDLIFDKAKTGEWRARRDSNPRPSA